jgi:hypothetical protein
VSTTGCEDTAGQSYDSQKFLHITPYISQKSWLSNRYFAAAFLTEGTEGTEFLTGKHEEDEKHEGRQESF